MTTYMALLRGINVGGKNIIKMAELRSSFESLGLNRVQTYIQSGNVLFESNELEQALRKLIEHKIEENFGFPVTVVLRTASELEWIAENCPFSEEAITKAEGTSEGESLYVALLLEVPTEEGIERLGAYKTENEEFHIEDREIYLLFRKSIRKSKLANQLQKLGVPVTIRNWKTINKLITMVKATEE
ncbi:DUF1697 domain-containing protein [Bacillus sp. DJP31]|uniref:DUF1697 domain-containing protein n=1 Tax=Bacillus sp. DJP31 TaxID=3409789 RepID=UPI003BB76998